MEFEYEVNKGGVVITDEDERGKGTVVRDLTRQYVGIKGKSGDNKTSRLDESLTEITEEIEEEPRREIEEMKEAERRINIDESQAQWEQEEVEKGKKEEACLAPIKPRRRRKAQCRTKERE